MTAWAERPAGTGHRTRLARRAVLLLGLWAGRVPAAPTPLLSQVMQRLAAVQESRATFTERKTLAALSQPLTSQGRLVYRRPDVLQMITDAPVPEVLAVQGRRLTLAEQGAPAKVIDLAEQPQIAALVDAVLGTLSGDIGSLRRSYDVAIEGTLAAWVLVLRPANPRLTHLLKAVTVGGSAATLERIQIVEANGDRSEMTVYPAA